MIGNTFISISMNTSHREFSFSISNNLSQHSFSWLIYQLDFCSEHSVDVTDADTEERASSLCRAEKFSGGLSGSSNVAPIFN